jgi:hypothetical protein
MHKTHGRSYPTVLLIIALIGSISLAAASEEPSDKSIVGFWFGARLQKATNTEVQEICHFKSDGTFTITFRKMKDGQLIQEQDESGKWEVNGKVKTMVTTHINGKQLDESKYITDQYVIIEVTDSDLRYEHMKSGAKFRLTRVQEGFTFPKRRHPADR